MNTKLPRRTSLKSLRALGRTKLHAMLKAAGGPAAIPARHWGLDSLARTVEVYCVAR